MAAQWQNNEIKALHQLMYVASWHYLRRRRDAAAAARSERYVGRNCACDPCVRDAALESIIYCLGITCRRPAPLTICFDRKATHV